MHTYANSEDPDEMPHDVIFLKMLNLGSSFVQTWSGQHPQYYIPRPKVFGLLVPEKKISKVVFFKLIWALWPSWSYDQYHLCKFLFPHPKESPYKFDLNWS